MLTKQNIGLGDYRNFFNCMSIDGDIVDKLETARYTFYIIKPDKNAKIVGLLVDNNTVEPIAAYIKGSKKNKDDFYFNGNNLLHFVIPKEYLKDYYALAPFMMLCLLEKTFACYYFFNLKKIHLSDRPLDNTLHFEICDYIEEQLISMFKAELVVWYYQQKLEDLQAGVYNLQGEDRELRIEDYQKRIEKLQQMNSKEKSEMC